MKILFFDGMCPMCHGWVRHILKWDKAGEICFSPLEGELASKLLTPLLPDYLQQNSIVFYEDGKISVRSTAALRIASTLGFPYHMALIGYLAPRPWRDAIYTAVANRRYKYGKRYDVCPIPPSKWKERFV